MPSSPPSPSSRRRRRSSRLVDPKRKLKLKACMLSHADLTKAERDLVLADLAQDDRATLSGALMGRQTWSRCFAEKLSKFKWYHPRRDDPDAPDLKKGWAYFELFTLPRRHEKKVGGHLNRSPPGEARETKLYSVFWTPQNALSDWGIGMSMYFASLRATFIILVLAGVINLYNAFFYVSDEYDVGSEPSLLHKMTQFSAVCSDREWVVCSEPEGAAGGCGKEEWDNHFSRQYYGTAKDEDGNKVVLINRTTCDMAQIVPGTINYVAIMFFVLCMAFGYWYLDKKGVRFDEDNTTPSDYSLVIRNPPPDALDPDEWRDFFGTFCDKSVTLVTVALDNETLVDKLVQRRKDIQALKRRLPMRSKVDFCDEAAAEVAVENARSNREDKEAKRNCLSKLLSCVFGPLLRYLGFGVTETMIWQRVKVATEEIKELQKKEYKAAAVYVTFETELGQRTALRALNSSELEIMTNKAMTIDSAARFQGRVLRAEEASEPSDVRWTDLHYGRFSRALRQALTLLITILLTCLCAIVLIELRLGISTIVFSVILTFFNSIIPTVVRLLVSNEKHYNSGSMQRSFYVNITVFRWMNTVVLTRFFTTPILATIGDQSKDLIKTINSSMLSEMVVSPLLRYFDVSQILKRHYFAPRAKTEEEMLSYFVGGWYNLAERFTDFTKVLLLCTFFAPFYPLMFFLGAGIIFFQYWMDKFLLLRSWQRAPYYGPETAHFSRKYFGSFAIVFGVISSAYAYFENPFTLLCSCSANNKTCTLPDTQDFKNVELLNDKTISVQVANDGEGYYYCDQDVHSFPPIPSNQGDDKWMTNSQERLTRLFGWTCLIMLILYVVFMLGELIVSTVTSFVKGVYEPSGKNQNKDFSDDIGEGSVGYIPQLMEESGFHLPLLICDIDDIDVELIGWKDPNWDDGADPHRSFDNHNLIFDVPHETLRRSRNEAMDENSKSRNRKNARPIFSVVKHYPPEWALNAREKKMTSRIVEVECCRNVEVECLM